jgi:CubicO group peptidase (beta-lactamase class C family)
MSRSGFATASPTISRRLRAVFLLLLVLPPDLPLRAQYRDAAVVRELSTAANESVGAGNMSGVSLALVDDQETVVAAGFGWADKRRRVPASAETVYRVGSISKLFTAIAAMQLAEQGRLDIDAPVGPFVPEFSVVSPFKEPAPVTLRQLMCHRSGVIREAPVGSYFDPTEPGARATVRSLAGSVLVHPPGTVTKYSNSGVTVVGRAVEETAGMPFERYQAAHVLGPLGMTHSAWRLDASVKSRLAKGYLAVAREGGGFREIEAPQFEFGILPAGNLYSTVGDLARFISCLFAEARTSGGPILRPETLREMWTVQLSRQTNGFGLGFSLGNHRGFRTVSHSGAVYGFSSWLTAIPELKLGVVVLNNDDIASAGRTLADLALDLMIEARQGLARPPLRSFAELPAEALAAFAGEYESESYWAELTPGTKALNGVLSGQPVSLRPVSATNFLASGRTINLGEVVFDANAEQGIVGFQALGQRFQRVAPGGAPPIPSAWQRFLGSYGPDFIPLIVTTRHGHLYAMTENMYDYRLTPLNLTVFKLPPGLYVDEQLVFHTDRRGRATSVSLGSIPLKRRR